MAASSVADDGCAPVGDRRGAQRRELAPVIGASLDERQRGAHRLMAPQAPACPAPRAPRRDRREQLLVTALLVAALLVAAFFLAELFVMEPVRRSVEAGAAQVSPWPRELVRADEARAPLLPLGVGPWTAALFVVEAVARWERMVIMSVLLWRWWTSSSRALRPLVFVLLEWLM